MNRRDGGKHGTAVPAGERLHLLERFVVAEERGRFRPLDDDVLGSVVAEGDPIGIIEQRHGAQTVVTKFGGQVIDLLVHPGELVREGEPVAWLRVA